jgi:hypothetical protein
VSTVQVLGVEKVETLRRRWMTGMNSRPASSSSSSARWGCGTWDSRGSQASSWPVVATRDTPSSGADSGRPAPG